MVFFLCFRTAQLLSSLSPLQRKETNSLRFRQRHQSETSNFSCKVASFLPSLPEKSTVNQTRGANRGYGREFSPVLQHTPSTSTQTLQPYLSHNSWCLAGDIRKNASKLRKPIKHKNIQTNALLTRASLACLASSSSWKRRLSSSSLARSASSRSCFSLANL